MSNKYPPKKLDVYEIITSKVIESLEKGVVPWHQPWKGCQRPANLTSGKSYRGVNVWLLNLATISKGYNHNLFMTFNQAKGIGASIKKGEHGWPVVFWKWIEIKNKDYDPNDETSRPTKKVPFLRYFVVFNVDQCEGIPEKKLPDVNQIKEFNPIALAEEIVAGYKGCPEIIHNGTRAAYRPLDDTVHMPQRERFESEEMYYTTQFHELLHSTGAEKRLNRKEVADHSIFNQHDRGIEELVAEFGAAYLCAEARIDGTLEHSAGYIKHWLGVFKDEDNKKWIAIAASRAQKATDHILGNEINIKENGNS